MINLFLRFGRNQFPDKIKEHLEKIIFFIKFRSIDYFNKVEIETITECNRRCWYCPNSLTQRSLKKNKKIMSTKIYFKIINDLKKINFIGKIAPHFYGEPLLDKRLEFLIQKTKKMLPNSKIIIYTNGELLSEKRLKSLFFSGIDELIISLHNSRPSFKKHLTKILENSNFRKNVKFQEINKRILYNKAGLIKKLNKKFNSCPNLHTITIDYAGNVLLCCNDYFSQNIMGNVKKQNLLKIWKSKQYFKIRLNLRKNNITKKICKKCLIR